MKIYNIPIINIIIAIISAIKTILLTLVTVCKSKIYANTNKIGTSIKLNVEKMIMFIWKRL